MDERVSATKEARFWAKVTKGDGCWEWAGFRSREGYGQLRTGPRGRQKQELAHRVSWEVSVGPIPAGLLVCHHCDNPPCVRPDHLFVGTSSDNLRDSAAKGRMHPGSQHGMSKLIEAEVRAIRASTLTQKELSLLYGVDRSVISNIKRRRAWTHVA